MLSKIEYFDSDKNDNSLETFRIAGERLKDSEIKKVVLASTTGTTARRAMEFFKDKDVQLVVIPHQFDFSKTDNLFDAALIEELRQAGHAVHFGTMLFHTEKLFGTNIPGIIANFLRCFSEGVKVCYEIVLMASDAGLLSAGEKVIAIAGTGKGADTAMVIQAASTQHLNKLKVNELLCKPINAL